MCVCQFLVFVVFFVLCTVFVLADDPASASVETPPADVVPVAPSPSSAAAPSVASRLIHRVTPPSPASEDIALLAEQAEEVMSQYLIDVVNALPDRKWTAGVNDYFQVRDEQNY